MNFIFRIIISTLAILIIPYILPGVRVDSILTALLVALVLAFLNAVVKPIMILFTIPVTIFSFGLFLIVINAVIILIADNLVTGFEVESFWIAVLFSIVLWLCTSILEGIQGQKKGREEEG